MPRNELRLRTLLQSIAAQAVDAQDDCLDAYEVSSLLEDIAEDLRKAQKLANAKINHLTILQYVEGD